MTQSSYNSSEMTSPPEDMTSNPQEDVPCLTDNFLKAFKVLSEPHSLCETSLCETWTITA